ncbi:HTH DNA binding domain protein [Gordonia phage GEazy]|nr:HTH DNA binding domain protein [Gordonia phage GEazy]
MPETPAPHRCRGFRRWCGGYRMTQTAAVLAPEGSDSLLTADEAATLCGVSAKTVRAWANRGYCTRNGARQKLDVVGRDERGRNLYRAIDVAKAEYATSRRSRR